MHLGGGHRRAQRAEAGNQVNTVGMYEIKKYMNKVERTNRKLHNSMNVPSKHLEVGKRNVVCLQFIW